MFENIMKFIEELNSNLRFDQDNYDEEINWLNQCESDLAVLRTLNTPMWKIKKGFNEIKRIRDWIKEEIESRSKPSE